jgi:endonuclease YncB( thermonuclease family)
MRGVVLVCLFAAALTGGAPAQEIRCAFEDAGTGTVRAVLDGRTLALTDGREVRLAAIEAPDAEPAGRLALEKMLGGRAVTLKRLGESKDRHGRLLAHVFAQDDARSIQQALLAAGHARVAARVGDMACARQLLGTEQAARAAGLGLWSGAAYAPRQVDDPAAVLAERGRFTLVEGKVVSVRESGGTVYVNFGRRWSEDFTATVLKRNERGFAAAGLDLKTLSGRSVRLRGVIEERGGPWIELIRPEQVEILGGP